MFDALGQAEDVTREKLAVWQLRIEQDFISSLPFSMKQKITIHYVCSLFQLVRDKIILTNTSLSLRVIATSGSLPV